MSADTESKLLLGKHTPLVEHYAPELLYPMPRSIARETLGISGALPFEGTDVWHAYEMSWLDQTGRPIARVGRFSVPATSPNLVESKSFKMYLNSLNNHRFDSVAQARDCIEGDISKVAGETVTLELFNTDDNALAGHSLAGESLDECAISAVAGEPSADLLKVSPGLILEERLYSHLLRSLCPVTGQPDWATVWLHYRGAALERGSVLDYLIAYRNHREFHEQCVERMFCDIKRVCQPEFLHIQALYTRRGGLDISPFRSTEAAAKPLSRLNRQ
ncbi:MAG: NADPH-dependent 7-cyano-7-deazaguanine reductase QueF [Halieaceae bacterium]|nr:NADPH-dependent 7-cyano-7-deazaguanine reductase QueF [Halieaceae bacterium]